MTTTPVGAAARTTTSVSPEALRAVAHRVDAAADVLLDVARAVDAPGFEADLAGRAHAADGAAVHAEIARIGAGVRQWAAAARGFATALRSGADAHALAEECAAARVR